MKSLKLALLLCFAGTLCAQTATPPPDAPSETKKGLRGLMHSPPLSYSQDAPPLSVGQKFELFAVNTLSPYEFVSAAASAGISQAEDNYHAYGQGAEGYGKRFGAAYADNATTQFFGTFLFPSLFRHDPRYFRKATGGAGSRIGYAVTRIFVTRTDAHGSAPNVSLWMGAMASAGIGNAYYPESDRSVGDTFSRAGISIGTQAGFNLLKEFWPDIKRKLRGKKH